MMVKLLLKLVGISVLLKCSHELKLSAETDNKFGEYLTELVKNYSLWLTQNQMDPTPPAEGSITIRTGPLANIEMECELRNQQGSGISVASIPRVEVNVNFTDHSFEIYREIRETINLFGDFNCAGKVQSVYFPELNKTDVFFNGEGHFSVNTSSLDELMYFLNVGVTENYTLDYEHRYIDYTLWVNKIAQSELNGVWNDSMVTHYQSYIEEQFFGWYVNSLDARFYEWKQQAHPLFGVYKTYMDIETKDFDLKTLLSEEELPLPYKPTPIPTTTPGPTTEVATSTAAVTSASETATTAETTLTTSAPTISESAETSESTTPNNVATRNVQQFYYIQYFFSLCLIKLACKL